MDVAMTTHSKGQPYPTVRGNRIRNFVRRLKNTTDLFAELHEVAGDHGLIEYLVLNQRFVLISDPVLAEQVFLHQHQHFHKGKFLKRGLEHPTIVTGDGEDHQRRRKLYQPALARKARTGYHPHIVGEIDAAWGRLSDGEVVDLNHASKEMILNIANKIFFGGDAQVDADLISRLIDALTWNVAVSHLPAYRFFKALPLPGNIRYRRLTGYMEARIAEMVRRAREDTRERSDLLWWLATATDDEGIDEPFTAGELRDEIYVLLFASHDTAVAAFTLGLYYLSRNPGAREKMEREVDEVLGGRLPEPGDTDKLVYTRAVFNEILRVAPPAAYIGRQAVQDVMIDDYFIPKDTIVHVSVRIPMREERWFHDAEEFIPERWLEDPQPTRPRYAYAPFGGGPRVCTGMTLAVEELVPALAILAQRWRFDPVSEEFPKITDAFTCKIKGAFPVRVSRRPTVGLTVDA